MQGWFNIHISIRHNPTHNKPSTEITLFQGHRKYIKQHPVSFHDQTSRKIRNTRHTPQHNKVHLQQAHNKHIGKRNSKVLP